jgi:hypothetical protein
MVDLAPRVGYQADSAAASSTRRYYVLALLTIIYALNFLDRTIFNVLIEPIKKEFTLSDTTMGLLAGFGFVLFYSLLGIPIARVADRLNRRNIVALAFAFWSAMTFLCGMASSVATLTLARIGVGIGESAGTPASQSLLADLFGKNERPRALGIYAVGTYLGVFLGYFIGGYVNQHYGWRMAFFSAGLPGIALAAVVWLTVAEPKRGVMAETFTPEPIGPTLGFLASQKSFVIVLIGFCLTTYTNYATAAWIPPFLARVHHLNSDLCRHLQGPVRDGRHAGRRPRGRAHQPPRRSLEIMGAGDHLRARGTCIRAVHADAGFCDHGRGPGGDVVPGRLPPRADLCHRANGSTPQHARAGLRHHPVDRDLLWPGRRTAGGRHDQRRAEGRLRRRCRAVFAAVRGGYHHARRAAVRMGRGVHPRRHQAGDISYVSFPVYFSSCAQASLP